MQFEAPYAFLILLVIPLMIWMRSRRGKSGTVSFSSTDNAGKVGRSVRQQLAFVPLALRIVALILLAVALARPQEGKERIRDISKGIAIEMVVDRSSSMGQEMEYDGLRSNRLGVVKSVFEKFVAGNRHDLPGRPSDLIGMIAFARYPDTICPLSLAHGALSEFLGTVRLADRQNEDGTAIGDALALAAARLKTAEQTLARQAAQGSGKYEIKSKIIILLTDGENNAGKRDPLQAAKLAAKWGIKIYTIGVGGGDGMASIQTPLGIFKMPTGSRVQTELLERIAKETGGVFRMADDGKALQSVYREIDRLERTDIESMRYMDYKEFFVPFALAGLILLCIEVLLSCTVFRRIP